jgi:hypothetical protein
MAGAMIERIPYRFQRTGRLIFIVVVRVPSRMIKRARQKARAARYMPRVKPQ